LQPDFSIFLSTFFISDRKGEISKMKQAKLFGSDEQIKVLTSLELAKAEALAKQVEETIKPLCEEIKIVGSIRRKRPMIGDIDFVFRASDVNWSRIINALKKAQVICSGSALIKLNIPFECNLFQVDFYRALDNNFGIQELIRTGSAEHNTWLASYAISKGYRLKYSDGLVKDGQVLAGKTEESIFSALGLPCPKPEEREIVNGKPVWLKTDVKETPT
jgi:DNA polymerase/3'-5' exonuclease PolX